MVEKECHLIDLLQLLIYYAHPIQGLSVSPLTCPSFLEDPLNQAEPQESRQSERFFRVYLARACIVFLDNPIGRTEKNGFCGGAPERSPQLVRLVAQLLHAYKLFHASHA